MGIHIGIAAPIASADVAHLCDRPAAGSPRGCDGAPLLGTLITELLRRGHRVSAFTLSSDLPLRVDATVLARGPGFELHFCPMRPRAWPFNGSLPGRIVDLYAFERGLLARAIAQAQPEIVHAHWSYEFACAAVGSGLPHVVTCHDSPFVIARFQRDFRHGGYRWLRAAMAWHVLRRAQCVTTVSPYMVEQVQPLCRVPVRVVPNPVVLPTATRSRPADAPRRRVVMVSNGWDLRKNSRIALAAFELLSASCADAELRVFGHDHGEGGAAHSWWRQSGGRADIAFIGAVAHARVVAEIADADVFLHTALEESFGAVLAEAMAAGVPVVAGRGSGAVPWVVQDAGLLVDVTRPAEVAHAVLTLLRDKGRAQRMGARGRHRVGHVFSAAAVVDAYEHEYVAAMTNALTCERSAA